MVADFVMARPNIAGAQSYHNAGGMILRGPGANDDAFEAEDLAVFDALGKKGELILPGYRYMNVAKDLYEVYGGELDWFYAGRGIYTFTNELFTPFNLFRKEGGGWFGRDEDLHLFNKYLLFEEGFIDWHEVDHPQYGKVEVGGFKKSWMRQPPSFLLEEECHRNMAFTLYQADQMPRVRVQSVETKDLGDGLTQVSAAISNEKLTPTRAAVDVKHRISAPDRVSIEGGEVVVGLTAGNRFFNDAREQERDPANLKVERIGGMGAVYVRWIVRGAGPFTVSVRSVKGGIASKRAP